MDSVVASIRSMYTQMSVVSKALMSMLAEIAVAAISEYCELRGIEMDRECAKDAVNRVVKGASDRLSVPKALCGWRSDGVACKKHAVSGSRYCREHFGFHHLPEPGDGRSGSRYVAGLPHSARLPDAPMAHRLGRRNEAPMGLGGAPQQLAPMESARPERSSLGRNPGVSATPPDSRIGRREDSPGGLRPPGSAVGTEFQRDSGTPRKAFGVAARPAKANRRLPAFDDLDSHPSDFPSAKRVCRSKRPEDSDEDPPLDLSLLGSDRERPPPIPVDPKEPVEPRFGFCHTRTERRFRAVDPGRLLTA